MKKTLLTTALATAMIGLSTTALAQDEYRSYVGIDYQLYSFSTSGQSDLEPESIVFKLGSSLGDYAKIEGRFGRSVADDNNRNTALKVDEIIGFYVKGGMQVADMLFPYAIIGFTKVDFEFYQEPDQTESDLSYGVGADLHFGRFQVGAEWMMMQDKSDYELEVVSLSAAWRF